MSRQKPKGHKRPRAWHRGPAEGRKFVEAMHELDPKNKQWAKWPKPKFRKKKRKKRG